MRRGQWRIVFGVRGVGLTFTPVGGHSSILMRLQKLDSIFSMGVYVMRPAFNLEPKYRVTMLTRVEQRTRDSSSSSRAPLVHGSRTMEGTGVYGQSLGRRLSTSVGKYAKIFQAEVYAILAFVYEIQTLVRPEIYVSIAVIVRWLCKNFRLSKQYLHWYNSAQGGE